MYKEFVDTESGFLFSTDLASRGLDFPDVHLIVQYDPPQDPDAFIHRVGRTARMGKDGSAVLFLTPQELDYIDYLTMKKVPIAEHPIIPDAKEYFQLVKAELKKDREFFDKVF